MNLNRFIQARLLIQFLFEHQMQPGKLRRYGVYYVLEQRGYGFDSQHRHLLFIHSVQTDCGAHPATYATDTCGTYTGTKRPLHESEHSPQTSAKANNAWNYTPVPNTPRFNGVVPNSAQGQFCRMHIDYNDDLLILFLYSDTSANE